jgi:hypothetical protein
MIRNNPTPFARAKPVIRIPAALISPHQSAIFERLEATKKYGLVSEYFVSWTGRAGRLKAKVTVWGNGATSGDVVQHYISQLLKDFVPAQQINVAAE